MKSILVVSLVIGSIQSAHGAPQCFDLFKEPRQAPRQKQQQAPVEAKAEAVNATEFAQLPPGKPFNKDATVFRSLAERIEQRKQEFREILSEVDNYHGAEYELTQVVRTLRGVELHELENLKQAGAIKNVAVYGSTNIPLYTLILHAVLPASTGAHVWFRTPMASRETYVRAMAKIREIMPEVDLSNIHLLTENADVQYDNFRKRHVLGLNRKGTRPVREVADIVIFTGNPKTGDELRASIEGKLVELQGQITDVKTIFMQFGSGLNPVIVTQLAQGAKMDPAVRAAVQAIRINSSQDCIAPKFYMIHDQVADVFTTRLLEEFAKLKYGSRQDPKADYSSLTFAEGVNDLVAFRSKWAQYLTTPDAQIDPATKRVDPHVFVFPFDKFAEVELVDHYAPFLVMFKYSSKDQLESVANDPRVKSRAMFASVFGDSSNKDMVYLRKLFEDNFHATILNQSVFVEESGNFAFGGYSQAASSVTLYRRTSKEPKLKSFTYSRPLLFSKEAKGFFGPKQTSTGYAQIASAPAGPSMNKGLQTLITEGMNFANASRFDGQWADLKTPQLTHRPTGLKALREIGAKGGFHVVVRGNSPRTEADRNNDVLFYGDDVAYSGDLKSGEIKSLPGVVLHPSWIGQDVKTYNTYRGEANPHMGLGLMHPMLFSSKRAEFSFADAVWPGSMPRGVNYAKIRTSRPRAFESLERSRLSLLVKLDAIVQARSRLTLEAKAELVEAFERHLDAFFALVNDVMPHGAFIKNFNEATTGDLGNQITSYSQNSRNYAIEFVERINSSLYSMGKTFSDKQTRNAMEQSFYETGSKMITKLLVDPKDLLIQQRVKIKKTDLGLPTEVRVDFIDGEAVHSRARYTHEYMGPDLKEAEAVLNKFFARAPVEFRHLSGGADVAKTEDGRWVVIEFNFGSNSGTLAPELFPIEANLFFSKLRQRRTPLIRNLDRAFDGGVDAQREYLKSLHEEKDKWQKKSIREMSMAETARYFRDRYLDRWLKNPTKAGADQVLKDLSAMVEGVGTANNRDFPLLIHGTRNFMNRELMERAR